MLHVAGGCETSMSESLMANHAPHLPVVLPSSFSTQKSQSSTNESEITIPVHHTDNEEATATEDTGEAILRRRRQGAAVGRQVCRNNRRMQKTTTSTMNQQRWLAVSS